MKVLIQVRGGALVQSENAYERRQFLERLRAAPRVIYRGNPGEAAPADSPAPAAPPPAPAEEDGSARDE